MRKLNLIVVFNNDLSKGLFCIRAKEPYKGKRSYRLHRQRTGDTRSIHSPRRAWAGSPS